MIKCLIALGTILLSLTSIACSSNPVDADDSFTDQNIIDYSKSEYWLSLPVSVDKEADVFYLYPTAWRKVNETDSNICEIDNPSMLIGSNLLFKSQATAFETVGNIYAPYYRQADAAYSLGLSPEDKDKLIGGIPALDAIAAFDYYIKHHNNGRPFILAGHSQGSNILLFLLSKYMQENPTIYANMIAAYVIGYSVTEEYLLQNTHLKFAEGPDDTGVIISFNTEAPEVVSGTNVVVLPGALAINPINWSREETLATASENLGSIILNSDGTIAEGIPTPVMNYADAKVDLLNGTVICSTADVNNLAPGNPVLVRGVFHIYDYSFFYYNIRENAERRVTAFLGE